jgi:hypothetical protein
MVGIVEVAGRLRGDRLPSVHPTALETARFDASRTMSSNQDKSNSNDKERKSMQIAHAYVDVRPSRDVRLVEDKGNAEPRRTPVLPPGWAPLTREQQDAVLHACNDAPECLVFRMGSLWDPGTDFRVYCLTKDHWAGLWVASRYVGQDADEPGSGPGDNRQLLGLGSNAVHAVQIALGFFNWDLEAHGEPWRLSVQLPVQTHVSRPR